MDVLRYEVSPGVLQHLAATLQKLSRTGGWARSSASSRVLRREEKGGSASQGQARSRRPASLLGWRPSWQLWPVLRVSEGERLAPCPRR